MLTLRLLGICLFIAGLACGCLILRGADLGRYEFGLIRTWIGFGSLTGVGLLMTSLASGLSGAERSARLAGVAIVGLGAVAGFVLFLSKLGVVGIVDTLQPWVLLAVCILVGGVLLFGSRA